MAAILLPLLFMAHHDISLAQQDISAFYGRAMQHHRLRCIELHLSGNHRQDAPRITLNFADPDGGNPVQWQLWPAPRVGVRRVEEEELAVGAQRLTFPPQWASAQQLPGR